MQTVADLLKQLDLKLELPENILNMDVEGKFNSVEQKNDLFHTYEDMTTFKHFDYFEFKGENCLCLIIPDNPKRYIEIYKIVGEAWPRAIGKVYDIEGKVVAIT